MPRDDLERACQTLSKLPGITRCAVNRATEVVTVEYDPGVLSKGAVLEAVAKLFPLDYRHPTYERP